MGLVTLVIPGRSVLTADLALINFVAIPVYSLVAVVLGTIWGTVGAVKSLRWSIEQRDADRRDRIATLRVPWKLTLIAGILWLIGAGLFTLLYGLADSELIAKVGLTVVFGGIVVCANSYLLSEFALRPLAARALSMAPPRRPGGVGITLRTLLIWALGTVPVAGLMIVALFALARGDISPARLSFTVLVLGAIT
ncbi:MAG: adenylate/guanylate cyclase domain-containing protein, partial [Dehalococcoidia bacterium]